MASIEKEDFVSPSTTVSQLSFSLSLSLSIYIYIYICARYSSEKIKWNVKQDKISGVRVSRFPSSEEQIIVHCKVFTKQHLFNWTSQTCGLLAQLKIKNVKLRVNLLYIVILLDIFVKRFYALKTLLTLNFYNI